MTEPIIELIYNEINATRVMTKLKMSGMNNDTTDPREKRRNSDMRLYDHTYETAVWGLDYLAKEYEGKQLRKELQKWAVVLHKDGKRKLWALSSSFNNHHEGRALMHFGKSIIDAFKKLPRSQ